MDFQSEKSFGKLRLRAFQPYHQILCILKHVRDVRDRSSTPKGCNAIYVGDIRDRNNLQYAFSEHQECNDCFEVSDSFIFRHHHD